MFGRKAAICGALFIVTASLTVTSFAQESAEALYKEATSAYDRDDIDRAISLYEQVVRLQPDSVAARTDLQREFSAPSFIFRPQFFFNGDDFFSTKSQLHDDSRLSKL